MILGRDVCCGSVGQMEQDVMMWGVWVECEGFIWELIERYGELLSSYPSQSVQCQSFGRERSL